MTRHILPAFLLLGLFCAAAPAGQAAAKKAFDAKFGKDYREATATASPQDDAALAERILTAAKKGRNLHNLIHLTRKAYELGVKTPAGYDTAIEAMQLLYRKHGASRSEALEKQLKVRQLTYRFSHGEQRQAAGKALVHALVKTSDMWLHARKFDKGLQLAQQAVNVASYIHSPRTEKLRERLKKVRGFKTAWDRFLSLHNKLKANDGDRLARQEMIQLFVVEMDKPAFAEKYLDNLCPFEQQTYVPLAVKPIAELNEPQCLQLGQWYQGLSTQVAGRAQAQMLLRAEAYLTRYLKLHETQDAERTRAVGMLNAILRSLKRIEETRSRWVDLLKTLPSPRRAHWSKDEQGNVVIKSPSKRRRRHRNRPAHIPMSVNATGGYELEVRFVRQSGDDAVALLLPVHTRSVGLFVGGIGGKTWGLAKIDGKGPAENGSGVDGVKLEDGRAYRLHVRVSRTAEKTTISASLDNRPLVNWTGKTAELEAPKSVNMPRGARLGIVAGPAPTEIRTFRAKLPVGLVRPSLHKEGDPNDHGLHWRDWQRR